MAERSFVEEAKKLRLGAGEVSHAAVLCPSFYKAQIVSNPSRWDRLRQRLRARYAF